MKIKLIFLILGFSLLSQFSYSQIKGKVGKYGIDKLPDDLYENGTIEGIVQNVNGKLIIKDCLKCEDSPGPIIMIYNNWVQIGGKYNKIIDYFKGGSVTEPFLSIEIFKDNTRELVQEIYYTKNNKRTSPVNFWNSSVDYNNSVNEKFDGNFQEIINNEITKVRNSIVGYNLFVKEKNSNSQNSSVVSNNKSTTTKPKKYTTPPLHLSTKELGEWFDSEEGQKYLQQSGMLSAVQNQMFNQALNGSSTSSSSSSNNKSNGSKQCPYCNKEVSKPSLKNNPRCQSEYTKTTNPGYVLCSTCNGYGYKITNLHCDCIDGIGWCYDKDCPVSGCDNGWYKCSHCNGTGQSR